LAPVTGVTHYSLTIAQLADQLHPALGLTTLWGYNPAVALGGGAQPQRHLGGIIVAQRGVPIQITFTNALPPKHILPVDTSANFPDAQQRVADARCRAGFA
jgi:spore coat protein A